MRISHEEMIARINACFEGKMVAVISDFAELTFELEQEDLIEVTKILHDHVDFKFTQLIDLCGVDYLTYGQDEWITQSATGSGFSRGVSRKPVILDDADTFDAKRFAVIYHLLSVEHNIRLRLRVYTGLNNPPIVPSVEGIWSSANWFEREAFDMFGILFEGHPD